MEWYHLNDPGWGFSLIVAGIWLFVGLSVIERLLSRKRWVRVASWLALAGVAVSVLHSPTRLSSDDQSLFIHYLIGPAERISLSDIEEVRPYQQQRPRRTCLELDIHNDWHRFGEDCADKAAPLGTWLAKRARLVPMGEPLSWINPRQEILEQTFQMRVRSGEMEQVFSDKAITNPEYARQGLDVIARKNEMIEQVEKDYRTRSEAELRAELEKIRSIQYPK